VIDYPQTFAEASWLYEGVPLDAPKKGYARPKWRKRFHERTRRGARVAPEKRACPARLPRFSHQDALEDERNENSHG
jgi:hypothetical protein